VKWNDYFSVASGDMPVSVTIPAGAATYTMNIAARANQTGANPENVTVSLSADPAYQVGSANNATITITASTTTVPPPTGIVPPNASIKKAANGMSISWNSMIGKVYHVIYK